jgi:hypothetical protein
VHPELMQTGPKKKKKKKKYIKMKNRRVCLKVSVHYNVKAFVKSIFRSIMDPAPVLRSVYCI